MACRHARDRHNPLAYDPPHDPLFLFHFLHIASAIWFIGGLVSRQIVHAYAKRTDDVQRFATLFEAAAIIERTMVIPGSAAVGILGLILGLMTGAPILGFCGVLPKIGCW